MYSTDAFDKHRFCDMLAVSGVTAAKSNDAVLYKAERGPTRSAHCHLRELSADQPVTEAV